MLRKKMALYADAASGPVTSMVGGNIHLIRAGIGLTCYARALMDNSTIEYWSNSAGSYTDNKGAWLDSGTTSDVWIERTINSGSLNLDTIGASRVAMTSDRQVGVENSAPFGTVACNVTLDIYDASSGGNLVQSATYDLQATREI